MPGSLLRPRVASSLDYFRDHSVALRGYDSINIASVGLQNSYRSVMNGLLSTCAVKPPSP